MRTRSNRSKGIRVFEKKENDERFGEQGANRPKGTREFGNKEQTARKGLEKIQSNGKPLVWVWRIGEQGANCSTGTREILREEGANRTTGVREFEID